VRIGRELALVNGKGALHRDGKPMIISGNAGSGIRFIDLGKARRFSSMGTPFAGIDSDEACPNNTNAGWAVMANVGQSSLVYDRQEGSVE
jgi:hypothetical protein